jgi:hypothetical protein
VNRKEYNGKFLWSLLAYCRGIELRLRCLRIACSGPAFESYLVNVIAYVVGYIVGAFSKLRKVTISFVISVRPHGTARLPLNGFSRNLIFEYFSKICRENSGTRSSFLRMRNVSDESCREKQNTHCCLMNVFRQSCCL